MAEINYGEVSMKAGAKHKVGVLRKTKVNPRFHAREEPFHGKQGRADQGHGRQVGDTRVAGNRSIDTYQEMGTRAHAGGKPTRGGSAGPQKQPTHVDHINAAALTEPEFREGGNSPAVKRGQYPTHPPGGGKPVPGSASTGRPSSRGAPPMQRAGRQTQWDSAGSRRP
jgi:hypothetical protein